jgi:endonuclease-3
MAKLDVSEIHALIKTCGLAPAKAKNVSKLSQLLVERHGGKVPRTFEELEALPGVGHKTASVVMAQAFGVPAFPVDTHIHRLAARWGLSDGSSVEHSERDLKAVFPRERWNDLHLSIIHFGREHCPALRHDLTTCPICSWAASKKRIAEEAAKGRGGRGARRSRSSA